jgi:hypothetical protein
MEFEEFRATVAKLMKLARANELAQTDDVNDMTAAYWRGYFAGVQVLWSTFNGKEHPETLPRWDGMSYCSITGDPAESEYCTCWDMVSDGSPMPRCDEDCPEHYSLSEEDPREIR